MSPEPRTALLVTQPRAATLYHGDGPILEAVAGGVESGTAADAARREAWEEAGVRLGALMPLMNVYGLPAYCNERSQLFLAEFDKSDVVGRGGGLRHEGEFIEVVEMGLAKLLACLDTGGIVCAKTIVLILSLLRLRPDLFV